VHVPAADLLLAELTKDELASTEDLAAFVATLDWRKGR
jgi:hypothetical protein